MFKFGEEVEITGISFFEGVRGILVDKRNNNGGEYLVRFTDVTAPDKWFQTKKLRAPTPWHEIDITTTSEMEDIV